ncbi:MAG: dihydroneopterin aldolase [Flavobacteriales bacterium]|nr:dihydroneopterin aldolase [Flavobacteriales bacterium]|tara:strand:- start:1243 stop:1617 length:375 start_codon:yes stop_codon:yes gene_type:complete
MQLKKYKMALISIEGIKVFAFHGHFPEERTLGGHFIINVWVHTDSEKVVITDEINDTLDYVKIIEIVKREMEKTSKMIESPAKRIVDNILTQDRVKKVKVELEKVSPPVKANFEKISVTLEGEN